MCQEKDWKAILMMVSLSGGIMYVCIVSYFQRFSWHKCNIFLSEEKLNKES